MKNRMIAMLALAAGSALAQVVPWRPATEGWATGRIAQAEIRVTANMQAQLTGATGELVRVLLPADATNGWEIGSHAAFLTSAPPQSVTSVNSQTGAVTITAAQLGALTAETDAAALAALSAFALTNRPAAIYGTNQWIDGDGRVWQLATVAGAPYYEITGGGLGAYPPLIGEQWLWASGNTYTNATRPASPLSWAADVWELVLSAPGHYYEGAADAGTLTLADGNFDNEIVMTRMTPTVTATNLIGLLIRTTDAAWTNAQALAASALQPPATQGLFSAASAVTLTNGLIRAPAATNAARAVIAGTIYTNQLWGATGTNAQYRMSWDITNGTFKVEEILP